MITTCIFDLDGVIVDTAKFHYIAWKRMANELGFEFTEEQGEATKGVSRMASLDIVLEIGNMADKFSDEQKLALATQKNDRYLEYVNAMDESEVLPGVKRFLSELRGAGIKIALGSASKNARAILERCNIIDEFDVIVDGTMVSEAKPDPEVFLRGAQLTNENPANCVVFEDAGAGVEAAIRAGMRCVGVGLDSCLSKANVQIASFEEFSIDSLMALDK